MKNSCIFTEPNKVDKVQQKAGFFYAYQSGYQIPVDYSASCERITLFGDKWKAIAFLILTILIFIYKMPNKEKITPKLNNSKLKSTPVARHATLNLSGCRTNPYLFCLRKIFRDFLEEEKRGHCFTETRLIKKIEAARLMFPEAHRELFNYLKH